MAYVIDSVKPVASSSPKHYNFFLFLVFSGRNCSPTMLSLPLPLRFSPAAGTPSTPGVRGDGDGGAVFSVASPDSGAGQSPPAATLGVGAPPRAGAGPGRGRVPAGGASPRRRLGAPRPCSLRQLSAVAGHGEEELPPRRPDPRRPAPGRRFGGCGAAAELRGGAESFPAAAARPARRRPGVPAGR